VLHKKAPAEAVASRMTAEASTAVAAPATGKKTASTGHSVLGASATATPASATVSTSASRPRWKAAAAGAATAWWPVAAHAAGRAATRRPNEVPTPAGARWARPWRSWRQRAAEEGTPSTDSSGMVRAAHGRGVTGKRNSGWGHEGREESTGRSLRRAQSHAATASRPAICWCPISRGVALEEQETCSTTGPRRRPWRGRRSTRGAADGGGSAAPTRSGTGGTGTAGPPVSAGASRRRGAPGRDARRGDRVAAAGGRGRRQPTGRHAAVAASCARNGHSPLSVMIASGDFICMEWNYLHWLVPTRVKSLSGNWARATVSARLGRRATTVGGTVVAGK